ncbi:MAG: hypothetical protein LUE16_11935 [Lachnospiraceae bacterium]|nr:hypothetical protein [Lachnospiraceae bacterium]
MKKVKRKFKYVVKTHKSSGILGFTFGLINVSGLMLLMYRTFSMRGEATLSMGFAAFLMMVLSVAGLIMSLICISDGEQFHRFGWIGIVCNLAALASLTWIFNAGLA